jgi:aryl-alcohol dehydrogenase-like predicted oxidoreductase
MSSEPGDAAMRHRTLGRTGLSVSELGYGAWGIGGTMWIGADDDESLRALRRAIELGVNFLDTARGYGDGHSEELVGRAAREAADTVYVATKIPPLDRQWPARAGVAAHEAYPADWIVANTEQSLRTLGLEAIDVQQFHVWSDKWLDQGDWLEAVARLKAEGKVRFFGVSINDHQPESVLRLVESGHVDTIQLIYNIFDQSPADELFAAAENANVGVIVRVPFDEGALTGSVRPDTTFPEGDFRNRYFAGDRKREVWERVQAIAAELDLPVEALPEVALRFCLSNTATSTAIPGMRSVLNVDRNARAIAAGPLDESRLEVLRRHRFDANFY